MKISVMEIWLDTETGVNYLFRNATYGGGLTPLLDAEGKPVITPEAERWGELMTEFRYDTQLLIEDMDRQARGLKGWEKHIALFLL